MPSAASSLAQQELAIQEQAQALAACGDVSAAARLMDSWLARHDGDWGAWLYLAGLYARLGRREEAVAAFCASARQLEGAGLYERARATIARALEQLPRHRELELELRRLAALASGRPVPAASSPAPSATYSVEATPARGALRRTERSAPRPVPQLAAHRAARRSTTEPVLAATTPLRPAGSPPRKALAAAPPASPPPSWAETTSLVPRAAARPRPGAPPVDDTCLLPRVELLPSVPDSATQLLPVLPRTPSGEVKARRQGPVRVLPRAAASSRTHREAAGRTHHGLPRVPSREVPVAANGGPHPGRTTEPHLAIFDILDAEAATRAPRRRR